MNKYKIIIYWYWMLKVVVEYDLFPLFLGPDIFYNLQENPNCWDQPSSFRRHLLLTCSWYEHKVSHTPGEPGEVHVHSELQGRETGEQKYCDS